MTPEENDRIARLEKYTDELLVFQGQSCVWVAESQQIMLGFGKAISVLGDQHASLLRLFVSSPLISDEQARRKCLDEISRWECKSDQLAATFDKFKELAEKEIVEKISKLQEALKNLQPGTELPPTAT